MKLPFSLLFSLFLIFSSCQEDTEVRAERQAKEAQRQAVIFDNINKGWHFNAQPINETSRSLTNNWAEWRLFLNMLSRKPKSSLFAFQQKSQTLAKTAAELNNNIPIQYDLPEVRSRIAVIVTKMDAINLYIHLNQIPDKKIVQLIKETNTELADLQKQLDEVVRKNKIKMEEGESDMLQMLDTTRAIPSTPNPAPDEIQAPNPLMNPNFIKRQP